MILVFNALAWGFEHVPFDAALLASLAAAFPDEPLAFYAEKDHLSQTRTQLASKANSVEARCSFEELALAPRLVSARERWWHDLKLTRYLLREARRRGARCVLACYMHANTGFAAFKALGHVYRPPVLGFIHHGSLLRVFSSRRYHPLLSWANGRLRQIVLGDFIRDTMLESLPGMKGGLHSVRHPYFFQDCGPSDWPLDGPVTFSYLGLADEVKNFPGFVELAAAVSPSCGNKVRFDLVGGTREGPVQGAAPWVTTYTEGGPMPRETFERQLHETTYAVFPYHQEFYRVIASGSVLDAIGVGKPLIALRNRQFDEIFRSMGDIGYLCDSLDEMKATITELVERPPRARYRQQSENVLRGRGLYSTQGVAAQLRTVLA